MNNIKDTEAILSGVKIYSAQDVCQIFGFSRTHLWRLCRIGDFPSSRRLGANRIGWLRAEIEEWAKSLPLTQPKNKGGNHE